ncbi:MAG: Flp pilus assembly complex ATPase component TadA [Puniceicoccales bacterium]|nr:Flp pilus assembly complex ATPase component TadA [Puniceicoccales bacterium]
MISADDYVLQLVQERGLVSAEDALRALERVRAEGATDLDAPTAILDRLVAQGLLTWEQIINALALEFDLETVNLDEVRTTPEALAFLGKELAERHQVFPIQLYSNELEVAVADPLDTETIDDLSRILRITITIRLATPEAIARAIKTAYAAETDVDEGARTALYDSLDKETGFKVVLPTSGDVKSEDAPIIRYVNLLITEAIKRRASDIHLEPLEKRFRVRYRVDGVLHEIENPPKRLQASILSRLKLMAEVSLAEKRIPQDGRIQVKVSGKEIDLRVSVLPTVYGESIVMRILDKEGLRLGLPELGFFSDDQTNFQKLVSMADGIFLVTGPTGSGKSTTLYAALNYINKTDRKIITVEDPVEYQMTGINQVQVRREVGMTFAAALRSMLRQAPNIIMIGEIRDLETAEIAVNASLTGHMVFSTLHTNDAPSAVTRLVDIGMKPFLVSASLRGVLAQRLVRRICPNCAAPHEPSNKEINAIGITPDEALGINFLKGTGCPNCNNIGYKGRRGIFEMFVVGEELQSMIYSGSTLVDLRRKCRELGMRSMREDGVRKVAAGITTVDEVLNATISILE